MIRLATPFNATFVELVFPAISTEIVRDCGYLLAAGIKNSLQSKDCSPCVQRFVDDSSIAIRATSDKRCYEGNYKFQPTKIIARLASSSLDILLPLAGQTIRVGNGSMRLGVPTIQLLRPSRELKCRYVTIKGFEQSEDFLCAAKRQLDGAEFCQTKIGFSTVDPRESRRIMQVRSKSIVGYSLSATCESPTESIRLQSIGLGGRRHFGAGVFHPFFPSGEPIANQLFAGKNGEEQPHA